MILNVYSFLSLNVTIFCIDFGILDYIGSVCLRSKCQRKSPNRHKAEMSVCQQCPMTPMGYASKKNDRHQTENSTVPVRRGRKGGGRKEVKEGRKEGSKRGSKRGKGGRKQAREEGKEGRREGRKKGSKQGRKERRKEGREERRSRKERCLVNS